jgi:isopenicillin N synthase-like dioxygenase
MARNALTRDSAGRSMAGMVEQLLLERSLTDGTAVPVIDIEPFFGDDTVARQQVVDAVGAACRSIGFLVITGHGVPQAAIDAIYDVTRDFYRLPAAEKMKARRRSAIATRRTRRTRTRTTSRRSRIAR